LVFRDRLLHRKWRVGATLAILLVTEGGAMLIGRADRAGSVKRVGSSAGEDYQGPVVAQPAHLTVDRKLMHLSSFVV
jgi:hypothetical protein